MRFLMALLMTVSVSVHADLGELIQAYDQTSWQTQDAGAKLSELEGQLAAVNAMDDSSEVLMWRGAIGASVAREKGGVGALGAIKAAKKSLEASLDADGQNHMARAILANLLAKAPGWPLSVGNKKDAAALFESVLKAQPDNLIALQGFGDLMLAKKQPDEARGYYTAALQASPREGREMADIARQAQIKAQLDAL